MLAPAPQPSVLVAEEGDEIAVSIIPPPTGVGHDRAFTDYGRAMAYARLLRLEFSWKIVDRCDAATRRRAYG